MAVHFGLKRRPLLRGPGSKRSSQPCRCFLSPPTPRGSGGVRRRILMSLGWGGGGGKGVATYCPGDP